MVGGPSQERPDRLVWPDGCEPAAELTSLRHRPSPLGAARPWQPDAVLLGVIRDQTPEVVEYDGDRPLIEGDRVTLAARKDQLDEVACAFTG